MSNQITIKIRGDKECIKAIDGLITDLENATMPLNSASQRYLKDIAINFKNNGTVFGEKWQKLHPATIAEKRKLYAKGKSLAIEKPLLRKGWLRSGFTFRLKGKNISRIFNKMSYAGLHDEGGTTMWHGKTVRIPKRVLLAIDTTRVNMVAQVFTDWVNRLIKKHII